MHVSKMHISQINSFEQLILCSLVIQLIFRLAFPILSVPWHFRSINTTIFLNYIFLFVFCLKNL